MSNTIFVIGAALTDLMGFPSGQPAPTDSVPGLVRYAPGGVGRNLAENLARLQIPTELITAFGDDDFGRELADHCRKVGIGTDYSITAKDRASAINLAILDAQYDLYAGVADLRVLDSLKPDHLDAHREALAGAEAIALETSCSREVIEWLTDQEWEAPLYLDPVSTRLSERVEDKLHRFHTLKANRRQAETLAGRSLLRQSDLDWIAHRWLDKGLERVFITLGSGGAFAADRQGSLLLPAAKLKVANTTGAGDAFLAGIMWATRRGWPLEDCCRAGVAAATIALRSVDAINPAMNENSLLEQLRKLC